MAVTVRIDAHQHLWDLTVRPQPWTVPFPALARSFGVDDLLPELRRAGVDGTVLVQTLDLAGETPEMLVLAAQTPEIRGVVGWVDLQAADVGDCIGALRSGPGGEYLVGIRHGVQSEPDPDFLRRPAVRRGLRAVAAAGLAFDMLVTPSQILSVVEIAAAVPELRMVLDHCGKPDLRELISPSWRRDVAALAEYDSVAVKLSGLVTEADHRTWTIDNLRPAADTVLRVFGPARVMIGSDWPACLPAASYAQVMDTAQQLLQELSPVEFGWAMGGTAIDFYGLNRGGL